MRIALGLAVVALSSAACASRPGARSACCPEPGGARPPVATVPSMPTAPSYGAPAAGPVDARTIASRYGLAFRDTGHCVLLESAEVKARFYGCGSPIPPALEGATVLDLGCGSGRDCYVLSKLVGAKGRVVGLDMTGEQLAVARRHQGWHAGKFGWANTDFRQGYIEDLAAAGIADSSVDLVVSNCVVNLAVDKSAVFNEMHRLLRPGGRIGISDVVTEDRLTPAEWAERGSYVGCIAGALPVGEYRGGLEAAGLAGVSIEFTHAVGDGVHAAIVRATKPDT